MLRSKYFCYCNALTLVIGENFKNSFDGTRLAIDLPKKTPDNGKIHY